MTHQTHKKQLRLCDIQTRPEDFQFRHEELDRYHVGELKKAIEEGRDVGRIDVWHDPESDQYIVLDGHHRYAAYKGAARQRPVPVTVHSGTVDEVLLVALQENTKARLQMSLAERSDAAWCLVQRKDPEGGYVFPKHKIASVAGVSPRTVATMRKTMNELLQTGEYLPDHWGEALDLLKGRERQPMTDEQRELFIKAKADDLDAKVGKIIAEYTKRYPEAVAVVLERRMGKEFDAMVELYNPAPEDADDSPF